MLFTAMFLYQCSDYDGDSFNNPDVKVFVQQIKSGRYTDEGPSGYVEVPVFKKSDISALLFYAQDHTPLKEFPLNPISSINPGNYRLSQCLLWTVEKIRTGCYPSLTPSLMKKDRLTGKYHVVTSPDDINEVWEMYSAWWHIVESQPADALPDYYTCNPLSGTAYLWY
ncbi:MAG: DUF4943 domain-containing protein [Prevotella sp.]|nr:DUF4943 domain-containing protein [Prevotella sp.]